MVEENQKKEPRTLQSVKPVYAAGKSTSKSSQSAGNLPDGLVPLYTFYHGMPANTAKRLLEVAGVQPLDSRRTPFRQGARPGRPAPGI